MESRTNQVVEDKCASLYPNAVIMKSAGSMETVTDEITGEEFEMYVPAPDFANMEPEEYQQYREELKEELKVPIQQENDQQIQKRPIKFNFLTDDYIREHGTIKQRMALKNKERRTAHAIIKAAKTTKQAAHAAKIAAQAQAKAAHALRKAARAITQPVQQVDMIVPKGVQSTVASTPLLADNKYEDSSSSDDEEMAKQWALLSTLATEGWGAFTKFD